MGSGGSSTHQSHRVGTGGGVSEHVGAPSVAEIASGAASIMWSDEHAEARIVRDNPLQSWIIAPPITADEFRTYVGTSINTVDPNVRATQLATVLAGRNLQLDARSQLPEGLSVAGQRQAATNEAAAGAAETLAARTAAVRACEQWPAAEVSYLNDPRAFEDAYHAARERVDRGESGVPYMTENACGGLADPDGGRGFGVELEFDLPNVSGYQRSEALAAIARDLHAAGVSNTDRMHSYHASARAGYTSDPNAWRLEADATVAGEIVSPILYDTPETWRNLATVCEIIERHGGRATARTGSHVHVSTPDYDHNVEHYNHLLANAQSYEDTIFRLASNPERGNHRGTFWCRPGRVADPGGYSTQREAVDAHSGHGTSLNLEGMRRGGARDHAEFRSWDGSIDPAVIQAQVNISLGMTHAAVRGVSAMDPPHNQPRLEAFGTHRAIYGRRAHTGRDQWRQASTSARSLADLIFWRRENKDQIAALMAVTQWQGRRQRIT